MRLKGSVRPAELGAEVRAGEGPLEAAFTFVGGERPAILALSVVGPLEVGGAAGLELDVDADGVRLDGLDLALELRMDALLERLLHHLADIRAWAEAVPDGELLVKFQHGVQVAVSARSVVRMEGATAGPPDQLRLSEPLILSVDGAGLRLSHRRFRRLAALADVRIEGASLHPDGEVRLKGAAAGALDRVVRGGLKRASAGLSELVRRSPRFARVRSFLKNAG